MPKLWPLLLLALPLASDADAPARPERFIPIPHTTSYRIGDNHPRALVLEAIRGDVDNLRYGYGWPAEAGAFPEAAEGLHADLRAEITIRRQWALENKSALVSHSFEKYWETLGATDRLLSMVAEVGEYTGGAHRNFSWSSFIFDKMLKRRILVSNLFADPSYAFQILDPIYCFELNREPLRRDGTEEWMHATLLEEQGLAKCPPLSNVTMAPLDKDGRGPFDAFKIVVDPYEFGAFTEGSFETEISITPEIKRLIKPEYRASF